MVTAGHAPTGTRADRKPHTSAPNGVARAVLRVLREHAHVGVSFLMVHGDLDEALRPRSGPGHLYVVSVHLDGAESHEHCPVLVTGAGTATGPVLLALDDDADADRLAEYGAAEATRRAVPLRLVHVWTESVDSARHRRVAGHDPVHDADHLLAEVVFAHIPGNAWERQIVHDRDPARALADLSRYASLLVVGARSRAPVGEDVLGATTTALLGRTACPLAVLPR